MAKEIRCDCSRCKKNCESRTGFCSNFEPTYTTNADRIRAMTDEELAEFLDNNVPDCARLCPDFKAGCSFRCQHNQGKDFLIAWLQSEAEQEGKV